ncbi:MAG: SDR family NAD(P)-dependent oxidoreductase [Alphaproteobacteria bacterium]
MPGNSNSNFKHIIITGASSGIGAALALHYAAPGVRLGLSGQNAERLEDIAKACWEKGAEVEAAVLCVTDRTAMKNWLEKADDAQPIDLLIANAGISAGMGDSKSGEKADQVRRLFDVNLTGKLNTIEPILPRMTRRRRGHVALVSSLAGFRGWPGAPAYSASKGAVRLYGEALRAALISTGVKVHVICPGFVKSRMTAVNDFPMPFIMEADKAARIIANGIARGRGRIAFPWPVYLAVRLLSALPDSLAGRLQHRLPAKQEIV